MKLFSGSSSEGFEAKARMNPAQRIDYSDPMEMYGEGLRFILEEESSVSDAINWTLDDARLKRRDGILDSYRKGDIPKEIMEQYRTEHFFDLEAIAKWSNINLGTEYLTDEEIHEKIRDDLKVKREYGQELYARSNTKGKIAYTLGSMNAAMIDPATIPTFFIGVGAAGRGATWAHRMAKAGMIGMASEAPFETIKQIRIYDWKQNIMSDYSVRDAMNNVLLTTVGVGGLNASVTAVNDGLQAFLRNQNLIGGAEARLFRNFLENELMENSRLPEGRYIDQKGKLEEEVASIKDNSVRYEEPDIEEMKPGPMEEEVDVPEEMLDQNVLMESTEGELEPTTIRKIQEENKSIAEQAEAARGCLT